MPSDGKVLVAGAGIGGLALGCALQRAGLKFEIFERAPSLTEVGAGILVQTAAMLALRHLGLDDPLVREGHALKRGTGKTVAGGVLRTTPLDGFDAPTVAVHRARLQATLLAPIEPARIHTGREITHYEQDEQGVSLLFSDGSSAQGALLVGADGLHSAVRRQMLGDTPLRYAGHTSWRGIAPVAGLTPEHEIFEIWGRGRRVGIVPLGAAETYWFAVANAPEGERDTNHRATALAHFASFGEPMRSLIDATPSEQTLRLDIQDRKPVASWTDRRVTLLGDAAHPTTPNLGQGGCMAIEDAVVLAHCLAKHARFDGAFRDYEARRVAHTTQIVNESWQFGRVAQVEGRLAAWFRDLALRATPKSVIEKRLREAARFTLD